MTILGVMGSDAGLVEMNGGLTHREMVARNYGILGAILAAQFSLGCASFIPSLWNVKRGSSFEDFGK